MPGEGEEESPPIGMTSSEETVGGSTTTSTFAPAKPKMGGTSKQSEGTETPWTGGMPMHDWSGLVNPEPDSILPTQYRPLSIGSSTKSHHYRTAGLQTKFTLGSDLLPLQKKMLQHFEEYGLDTITYLPDPYKTESMACVVTDYARFTVAEAQTRESLNRTKFDQYDHQNDKDAIKFLQNSLDPELETQMYENCKNTDSFIVHWLNLMHILSSTSIERFDKIKEQIKARKISDYPGHNITTLVTDYLADWRKLHGARLYDNTLTTETFGSRSVPLRPDWTPNCWKSGTWNTTRQPPSCPPNRLTSNQS